MHLYRCLNCSISIWCRIGFIHRGNIQWSSVAMDSCCTRKETFRIGDEIYVPYRSKSNHQLFEDYGISIPFNRHSFMEITVPIYSDLCKNTDNGCTFRLYPVEVEKNYLEYFKKEKDPLRKYRQGVKDAIGKFKFALRHQRRRVKILEDRNLKQVFHLSISEKWTAYKVLALVDRAILKSQLKSLKLV